MRGLVVTLAVSCVLLPACGETPERGIDPAGTTGIAGLEARLVAEPVDGRGRYALSVPFEEPIRLALRVTNVGDVPMQVPRSSFPFHYFFKLEIKRVEEDGTRTPVPCYWELYPMKDMKMPDLEYVTLKPGESTERSMSVLIREGYGLESYSWSTIRSRYDDLRKRGFGELREPGTSRCADDMHRSRRSSTASPTTSSRTRLAATKRCRFGRGRSSSRSP